MDAETLLKLLGLTVSGRKETGEGKEQSPTQQKGTSRVVPDGGSSSDDETEEKRAESTRSPSATASGPDMPLVLPPTEPVFVSLLEQRQNG